MDNGHSEWWVVNGQLSMPQEAYCSPIINSLVNAYLTTHHSLLHHRQLNISGILRIKVNSMGGLDKIRIFCFENIWYKFLRIAINNREPCALNLYHYPVSFFKRVVDLVKINYKLFGFVGCKR